MKKIIFTLLVFSVVFAHAQDDPFDRELRHKTRQIDSIIQGRNREVDTQLDEINEQLEKGEIDAKDARFKKKNLAIHYSDDLDYTLYKKLSDIKDFAKDYKEGEPTDSIDKSRSFSFTMRNIRQGIKKKHREETKKSGTTSYLSLAVGINNIITGEQLQTLGDTAYDTPYSIPASHFFEIGMLWKTTLIKDGVFLRYGGELLWNSFRPSAKRIHIIENDSLRIVDAGYTVRKSKMKSLYFKAPLLLEFNLPRESKSHLQISLGVYGKMHMISKQKIKYKQNGHAYKSKVKGIWNHNRFLYGFTAGIGGNNWTVFADYDVTPLYYHRPEQLVNFGIRWDI